MKAIIVDDEPKAIDLLESYLAYFSTIELVASFRNGLKAFEYINKEKVDLIFLDINMPHLSGISLSKMISQETKIIFTTAYSEFAVESYEVEAIDYLLKPISLERFTKAITKVLADDQQNPDDSKTLLIKSGTKTYRISPGKILYLEKDGNYINYILTDRKIIARESISQALDILPSGFLQVHKSFIVNMTQVEIITKEELTTGGQKIPIGNSFKQSVLSYLS